MNENEFVYEEFIRLSRYARWLDDKNRRETWNETIDRYASFMRNLLPKNIKSEDKKDFENAINMIKEKKVMPSMRALWSAGKALEKSNIAAYNCAYTVVDKMKKFPVVMYILMHGTGVGFSVEKKYVDQMPSISAGMIETDDVITFEDSRLGWAKGYYKFIQYLVDGIIPKYDISKIRPAGSRLKTFGGRSSGGRVLADLLDYTINTFIKASGRQLKPIECHDLMCKIAEVVIAGGTRRSALISLSDLHDNEIKISKEGQFWNYAPERMCSNNSAVYESKPDFFTFTEEFMSMIRSGSGERGIVNREALIQHTTKRRKMSDFGVNPCSEISLRADSYCNLTEIIAREDDDYDTLSEKAKAATILGVLQSTLTNFKFIGKNWKNNCEEERLLGVSITGIMDNKYLSKYCDETKSMLVMLKNNVNRVSEKWAKIMDINVPVATTTVKPSGNVSQLCNTSSGIHARFSKYYIRRVRLPKHDAIAKFLKEKGVNWNPEVGQNQTNYTTMVFDFPIKSPNGSVIEKDLSALDQLKHWMMFNKYWAEHNVSVTIKYSEDEIFEIADWVWKNWNMIAGLSFLPKNEHNYDLAPYEEITEEEYRKLSDSFPNINFKEFLDFENDDNTTGSREFACTGGKCEI